MKKASDLNIKEIEKKINYTFRDKSLLIQAFTRTSYCNEINQTVNVKYHSNEVLEFFGDGVLSLSIISFLLKKCTERYEHGIKTELDEGDFSNIKSKLSDKQNLSKSMKALGLEKHLLMGEGDLKLGIQNEPSVMEDLFESIIGAIYIDSDMSISTVMNTLESMLDTSVYTNRQRIVQSAKNALQEWCADKKRRLPAPRYETLSEDGPDHKKTYMRACYVGDRLVGRGIGKNLKLADAAAAEDALKSLMAQEEQALQSKVVIINDKSTTNTEQPDSSPLKKSVKNQQDSATVRGGEKNTQSTVAKAVTKYAALKNYAASSKKPSPVFKDLGQRKVGGRTEYLVECSFMNESAVGTGQSRSEAREAACGLMLEKIGTGKKAKPEVKAKKTEDIDKKADVKAAKTKVYANSSNKAEAGKSSASKTKSNVSKSKPAPKTNTKSKGAKQNANASKKPQNKKPVAKR